MTFEDFSSGYYSLDMHIQPYDDGPVIDAGLYEFIEREVYSQTNAPVTMKLSLDNGAYFNVGAENGVPPSVLAIPTSWVDNMSVAEDGRASKVFVLKPGQSYLFHQGKILEEQLNSIEDVDLEEFDD